MEKVKSLGINIRLGIKGKINEQAYTTKDLHTWKLHFDVVSKICVSFPYAQLRYI